jgi:hypothetical protein
MPAMALITSEKRIWRELVQAHFSTLQIEFMLNRSVLESCIQKVRKILHRKRIEKAQLHRVATGRIAFSWTVFTDAKV